MTTTTDPIRVLHVDDDPKFAEMAATFLERTDERIVVDAVTDADAGLDRLAAGDVDCIVSDYEMPGRNGIEFLEAVRDRDPNLPFVLYTGKGSEEVASDAISAGVTDYLQKDGGTDQYTVLANRITNAVESVRSRRALADRDRDLRRYERMVNSMREAACIYDEAGRFEVVNEYLADWYGTTQEALVGEVSNLIPSLRSEADEAEDPYRALLEGERKELYGEIESEFPKHGTVVLAYRLTPLRIDGSIEGVVGVARDVTDRRRRERKLRESTSRLEALFEESPDMINVHDAAGNIIDPNPRLVEETGYDEATLTGMKVWELDREADPDELAALWARMEGGDRERLEGEYRRRDGSTFPVEIHVRRLDAREGDRFVAISRDISDRKERERERETTIEYLRRLCDMATDTGLDADGKITRILEVGPEAVGLPHGYLTRITVDDGDGREERSGTQTVIGASGDHDRLQPGDSYPLSQSYCRETIRTDGVREIPDAIEAGMEGDPGYETFDLGCYLGTAVTVDDELYGTVFFAAEEPRSAPFTEAERTFVRLTGRLMGYEIERERATDELQRRNDRLEEFASIVSHDLRNPLTVAEGRLELARDDCDSDHLDAIGKSHSRMRAMIEDLLELAREGDTVTDPEPVDLATAVEGCWTTIDTADATLDVDVEHAVRADESRLKQVFENLVRNSVKHGSTGSRTQDGDAVERGGEGVTVTVGELEDGFYVEDDGPGIPEDERDEAFKPGYSTAEAGTGLGLNIVEQVVEAHGWDVRLTEGAEGGARVEITGVEFATD